ncbi:MAG: Vacuolar protein sorting-associated protein 20 [Cyphobasidiales sp. Tagirdzhanova-0007]|nr:MAG: Vacuolar protein sorting-associated protein 20 [Cyphobasidiales sp. Tagirdzhanova-0007]
MVSRNSGAPESSTDRQQQVKEHPWTMGNSQSGPKVTTQDRAVLDLKLQRDKLRQSKVQSIEFSLVEKDVLFGLRQGTTVLKELNKEMSLESVEKLMGETADAVAYQKEVDEMLQGRMSVEDEEAVQAELAAMEAEQASVTITIIHATVVQVPVLPEVPTARLPAPIEQFREEAPEAEGAPPEQTRPERVAVPA